MNRKGWTRILIVVVAGLWGYNIYRTVENYQLKAETEEAEENAPITFAPVMFNKDTFSLVMPNQDPFLRGGSWNSNRSSSAVTDNSGNLNRENRQVKQLRDEPPKTLNWPEISYHGFLRNRDQDHQLCMLKIDGRVYRMSAGDQEKNVRIISAHTDSVVLNFNEEIKTFPK